MTTPDITPADCAAAAAFTLASGEFVDEDLLAERFAAWRVKERERCVAVLRKLADQEDHDAAGMYDMGRAMTADRYVHGATLIRQVAAKLLTPEANNDH